jgi:hypothetical protein
MNDRFWAALNRAEPATYAALRGHGYRVERYGQGLLPDAAREMLRGVPTPERWTPDFLVMRPEITDRPRWPERQRGKYTFFADAKYSSPGTGNHSIEMRSLLAAPTFGIDVYYVCSLRYGDDFRDFKVIHHSAAVYDRYRTCCTGCRHIFNNSDDPMHGLPEYCPVAKQRNDRGSLTPYFIVPIADMHPLSNFVFDILTPARRRDQGAA